MHDPREYQLEVDVENRDPVEGRRNRNDENAFTDVMPIQQSFQQRM